MMIGPLTLLVAAASPPSRALDSPAPSFQPSSAVSARSTVRIQIISGVRFGRAYAEKPSAGARRTVQLVGRDGSRQRVEILEFQ